MTASAMIPDFTARLFGYVDNGIDGEDSSDLRYLGLCDEVLVESDILGDPRFRGLRPFCDRKQAKFDELFLDVVPRQYREHRLAEPFNYVRRRPGRRQEEMLGVQVDV